MLAPQEVYTAVTHGGIKPCTYILWFHGLLQKAYKTILHSIFYLLRIV